MRDPLDDVEQLRAGAVGDPLDDAVEHVRAGGLLAFPTETVWGLGADARSDAALEALRRFKGRGSDAPVSILVEGADALDALGLAAGALARALARRFWPGPLTLVVPGGRAVFGRGVARSDGAVGVRCSSHPTAAALSSRLAAAEAGPITATSLNRSGEPAARTREEARAVCRDGDGAPFLLDTREDAGGAQESTVVDCCGARPEVLRWGAIDEPRLSRALAELAA